jgi:hypothetical protein
MGYASKFDPSKSLIEQIEKCLREPLKNQATHLTDWQKNFKVQIDKCFSEKKRLQEVRCNYE